VVNVPIVGTCRFTATIDGMVGGPAGGPITEGTRGATIRSDETIRIRSETFGCPEGGFESRGPLTLLGTETPITITLI